MDTWGLFMREAQGWKWYCLDADSSLPLAESMKHFRHLDLAEQDFGRFLEDYKAMLAHRYQTL